MSYFIATLLIGFVILFHEFGHFIAAKKVRIPIATFSIGFGPKIIGRKSGETEYRLSLIPIGGYVLPEIEDEKEFFALPVNKRIMMALGGPIASVILPVVCFSVIYSVKYGLSFMSVLYKPIMQASNLLYKMVIALPDVFNHTEQLSGIVGIVAQGGDFVGTNLINAFQFVAFISLNLAVLNLLPIPVLDGGKVLLYLLEKIHPKLLRLHFPLAIAGWMFVIGLMLYVTAVDIGKLLWVSAI
ncbi:MAG: Intramembrane protease RasP/YluC, implicated in cell division based on FtsL cleavage [Firmicutes bacterium]|nr:Intramembrane protease RasP/YluC, implicated in cell division based on FtsL cleavage [Bacillota bacterium]